MLDKISFSPFYKFHTLQNHPLIEPLSKIVEIITNNLMKSYASTNVVANDNNRRIVVVRDNEERKLDCLDGSGSLGH